MSQFLRNTGALIAGRGAAYLVALAIPVALARLLTPAEFGSYKQVFLIFNTLFLMLQFGMAESLYYFLPDAGARRGAYVSQTLVLLAASGACAALALGATAAAIGTAFDNPELRTLLPIAGLFLVVMMVSYPLEMILIIERRSLRAAFVTAASELLKAGAILVPIGITGDLHHLLWGLLAFGLARAAALGFYLWHAGYLASAPLFDRDLFRRQWAYAFPFGLAALAFLAQVSLDQYAIAVLFDPALFAVYAVGLFQMPVNQLVSAATAPNFMVELARFKDDRAAAAALWGRVTTSLALFAFPVYVYCWLMAEPIIRLLFTEQYLAGIPIYRVSLTALLLTPFLANPVLRVFGDTRSILRVDLARLALTAGLLPIGLATAGPPGALAAAMAANLIAEGLMLGRVRRRLERDWSDLLPWSRLGGIGLLAAVAAAPSLWIDPGADGPPLRTLSLSALLYGSCYLLGLGLTYRLGGAEWFPRQAAVWKRG